MPVRSPSKQSVATRKYEEKTGWMSKSYKMKREIVEQFAEACEARGSSQAGELMKFMKQFIEETKASE